MTDSTTDTGFISSDDEGPSKYASPKLEQQPSTSSSTLKPGIIRRTQLLDGIKEQQDSSPIHHRSTHSRASERSLEWFDEPK
jgi:hypothetical protein